MIPNPSAPAPGLMSELRAIARAVRFLWRSLARGQRSSMIAAAGVILATGAANGVVPVVLGRLVDQLLPGRAFVLGAAVPYLAVLAAVFLLREALEVVRKILVERTGTYVERDTLLALVSHLFRRDLSTLSVEKVGALHGRIHRSVEGLVRLLKLLGLEFVPALVTAVSALVVAFSKNGVMGLLVAAILPTGGYLVLRQLVSQKGIRLELMRSKEALDGTVVEQLGGLEYIRAAHTEAVETRRVEHVAESVRARELRHHVAMSMWDCAKALNDSFFQVLVVAAAIVLAHAGRISVGDVLTYSMLFSAVQLPVRQVHRVLDEAHESSLRVADLEAMLAGAPDVSFLATRSPVLAPGPAVARFEGLRVTYGGRPVLRGIDLSLHPGEILGVAGPSGSGKTTWLKVLLRLVHPAGGTAELGGMRLDGVSREAIGRLVGYVGQNPFVFSGTIAENIAYGTPGATRADVERAARAVNLHAEIMALPDGYDTVLAERGQNVSGGQRQRIALARVILKNPPVLILDEATSAVDNIGERAVHESLASLRGAHAIVLVAHRLSTLRFADRILVFDQGRIVEEGTYDELVAGEGLFADLVRHGDSARHPSPAASGVAATAAECAAV